MKKINLTRMFHISLVQITTKGIFFGWTLSEGYVKKKKTYALHFLSDFCMA